MAAGGLEVRFLLKWGTEGTGDGQFNMPVGVAVDSAGNVYVAERGNQRVQKFSSDGRFLLKWGSLWDSLGAITPGQFSGHWLGIAADRLGSVFVADNGGRVQKFSSDGRFLLEWGKGDRNFRPLGIAVDEGGNVYVTEPGYPACRSSPPTGVP